MDVSAYKQYVQQGIAWMTSVAASTNVATKTVETVGVSTMQVWIFATCLAAYVMWSFSVTLVRGVLISVVVTVIATNVPYIIKWVTALSAGPPEDVVSRVKEKLNASIAAMR